MSRGRKVLIGVGLVGVLAALAYANMELRRPSGTAVTVEKIERRDLEAIVSASGKVQPRRLVAVSNEVAGKVMRLHVREGDVVRRGQLLIQLDTTMLETTVQNREAGLASARSQLAQTSAQVENARVAMSQVQNNLRRAEPQYQAGLMSREQYERLLNEVKTQATNLRMAEQAVETQQQRVRVEEANLASAQLDFTKTNIVAPIDGIVTARLIEEGEMARWSAISGGVDLLTIADMSIIETHVDVDETDIPDVRIGQPAKVTIDALPGQEFKGAVTEVGNSPIQAGAAAAGRATNFRVKVTLDGTIPNVRPGFTCTAVITTATRQKALAVPIQAMTVREVVLDEEGHVVREVRAPGARPAASRASGPPAEPAPGHVRKEVEGVFVARDGQAVFVPVRVGIAGEKYFEVLSGLAEGEAVITGPFASVRALREGDPVRVEAATTTRPGAGR